MLLGVFCVFDSKAINFGMPFFTHNRGSAQRGIQLQLQQDPNSMLAKFPKDFALYDLGVYDDENGLFTTHSPQFIINISDMTEGVSDVQQP